MTVYRVGVSYWQQFYVEAEVEAPTEDEAKRKVVEWEPLEWSDDYVVDGPIWTIDLVEEVGERPAVVRSDQV